VDVGEERGLRIAASTADGKVVLSNGSVLTPRELDILRLVIGGARNREIAAQLFLTVHTVEYHMTHILQKLSARNRTEAGLKAIQLGLSCWRWEASGEGHVGLDESTRQIRRPIRVVGWRLIAPALLLLSGLIIYIAVSGMPLDWSSTGPANASASPSETASAPLDYPESVVR